MPKSYVVDKFENYFNCQTDTGVEFTRKNGKFTCLRNGPCFVNHTKDHHQDEIFSLLSGGSFIISMPKTVAIDVGT